MVDFEEDLDEVLGDRMRQSDNLCEQVWSAMANIIWEHESGEEFSASFRYAGGVVSDILGEGCYLDWYCCGPTEVVSDEIADAMASKGWKWKLYADE